MSTRYLTVALGARLVPIVPRVETEAWALADRAAFRRIPGAQADLLPPAPKDVERVADPKQLLKQVLAGRSDLGLLEQIGRDVGLDRLQLIPAYRTWLKELTQALKELHFL